MLLLEYIIIKDLVAKQIALKDNSVESLCINNDYVIERYRRETGNGNIDFQYKIYRKNEVQTSIKIGTWSVENIRSNSAWTPKTLYFDLVDPKGVSSADNQLPYTWINSKNITFIHAEWTGEMGINNMLELAKEASSHTYWLGFIKARFEAIITEKHTPKIIKLQEEVDKLKSKLTSIQSVLDSR